MTDTALDQFWHLVSSALTLNPEAFELINTLPLGGSVALIVVLAAGMAQAIGQSIVLYINQVKPIRFGFSLTCAAILFAIAYGFWALSVWFVGNILFNLNTQFGDVARIIGLSYAPQMLGFLVAIPYLGVPIGVILSIWSFLAVIVSFEVLTQLDTWAAFSCAALGWVFLQLCQRTIGRPITVLGHWLMNTVAGTQLVFSKAELEEQVRAGYQGDRGRQKPAWVKEKAQAKTGGSSLPGSVKIVIAVSIGMMLAFLFSPSSYQGLGNWYASLTKTLDLIVDLSLMSFLALLFAIVLTPVESLGWWAGWYGDEDLSYPGEPVRQASTSTQISRYVIYLDGISQGSHEYLPDVELLLNRLADAVPDNILIVKGIIPYSVTNRSLTEDRPLAFLWRIIDSIKLKAPDHPIGFIINIRNMIAVAVAADPRYGPIQNQGLAQVLFESLINFGYQVESQTPITLIGYSGGGQMSMASVSYLYRATGANIEVISLAGVISGNTGAMEVEHLYHLVGENDNVERLGPLCFPGRWPIKVNSNWNQAKRRGKISLINLGPVGHDGPTGPLDDYTFLPDGRSYMDQTVDLMTGILLEDWTMGVNPHELAISNYQRYRSVLFNQPESYPFYYPIEQTINPRLYKPVGTWMGRLLLPKSNQRQRLRGVLFEVHHTDERYQYLVGQVINLRWSDDPADTALIQEVTKDVHFVDRVQVSKQEGNVHPDRLNHWLAVTPLESLAGARPVNDVLVKLAGPVIVLEEVGLRPTLVIRREPVQISGRFQGLVTILGSLGDDRFQLRHYNPQSRHFDGVEEPVYIPSVVADRNGVFPSTNYQLEQSPVNPQGWRITGMKNEQGEFVVLSLAPASLFGVTPDRMIEGKRDTQRYIDRDCWANLAAKKGTISKVLLVNDPNQASLSNRGIYAGDRLLLIHMYGGIGGQKAEFAPMGIFFGHFSYGIAHVVEDPFTGSLKFEIEYRQIYTHNTDGIIAGSLSWERYSGDRQWGWMGCRPIGDTLIKFSPLTDDYNFDGLRFSVLDNIILELDIMAARYRIGDGTGTTFVTPINSCVQDSSQALYRAIERTVEQFQANPEIQRWLEANPNHEQTQRFEQLVELGPHLRQQLAPLRIVREDWQSDDATLGQFAIEQPAKMIYSTLASWRSLLPKLAHDVVTKTFLDQGAVCWMLRTNQVGGFDPDIEPVAPTDFGLG
ncbi:MAG: peptidase [Roseofilum sp. Belize BBD 4]|uniref:Yip1 family protein n=1 Tax=Roseofilum sp. Belize BBD 4 TaxID=2821500 RepID=UPI001B24FECC|nr:hypothetical protein [Roseofilum sp. Belize BBD 4]MBP0035670.1 peptidase [Roseofilum sp. Belize BBD 4]